VRYSLEKVAAMNWDQIKANWRPFSGAVRERWDRLTDDDLERIDGRRDQFTGVLQERYGIAKEAADKEVDEFAWDMKL
jgi:uncharacterized protein YjbJ (UPF0337 family)